MKHSLVALSLFVGLQLVSGTAMAVNVLDCNFYAEFSPITGEKIPNDLNARIAHSCKRGPGNLLGIAFSQSQGNTLELTIQDNAISDDGTPSDNRVESVVFPNLASAQAFKGRWERGEIKAIAFRTPNEFGSFNASEVIFTSRMNKKAPAPSSKFKSGWNAFSALFSANPLFSFPPIP